ncbi:hypothetical protein [Thermomonas sp.]|uniref:hypothetical protein n=1 Tax=Thermomonas sp. TaxID=1971895 RepID=UPI002487B551|nr:hypothetical protein [Thermomonas sp.]MDI1253670.1 hypothetical protein [Thermomonas sp.]
MRLFIRETIRENGLPPDVVSPIGDADGAPFGLCQDPTRLWPELAQREWKTSSVKIPDLGFPKSSSLNSIGLPAVG